VAVGMADDGSLVSAGVAGPRIDPRAYGLDGPAGLPVEDREERYFLEETLSGWLVYYWERGASELLGGSTTGIT
jgi:hypothetical protein